ncbi:Monofunctional biosynthetic peptidoglycan transglycosylase [Labilithrix luteola]|uniref:Monofunctional biosynthetic peptidoglycan transglycosylase n=1 Tax=Labilithrix luteola TaxID=1391654 RepID=A0A0K1PUI1_9BACT|nr:biosynthetic peptidoglycan transglycosylase [Labilithrix luteola]AKU97198.1 Monofunctional biosynthetic peptidoglycan transglycosylase [Labilithrix luteola]
MFRAPTRPKERMSFGVIRTAFLARVRAVPRNAWIALGAVAFAIVFAAAAFGPIVRARIGSEAAKRRLEVSVGGIRPGFFAIRLKDVQVRLAGVQGLEVRLDDVRVGISGGLGLREITAQGGGIHVEGEPEDLVDRLRAFRKDGPASSGTSEGSSRTPVTVEGLSLAWKMPSGGELSGDHLRFVREGDSLRLAGAHLSANHQRTTIRVTDGDVELGTDGSLRRLNAVAIEVEQAGDPAAKQAATKATATVEPAPPPLPPPTPKGKGARAKPAEVVAAPNEPVLPLPNLQALRARVATLATSLGTRVPDGTKVDVGGLSVKLDVGGEPFAFGPGPFGLERRGDLVRLSFTSEKNDAAKDESGRSAGTPLSVDAEIPLGRGDVTARLSGGPVSLALLGVPEGAKGLFDVGRGTVSGKGQVVLDASGETLTFDGQLALRSISVKQPRLSLEPIKRLDFSAAARGVLDHEGRLRIDDAQLDMGALHVRTHGTLEETTDHFGLSLALDVAPASCQALLDSAPEGLLPTVRAARMSGTFGATARIAFDTRTIDKLALEYVIDDRCKMTEVPTDLSHERFENSFTYRIYHPDGTLGEATTGPGTPAWTALDEISPFMVAAVLTTEDGAFYKHHGFNHSAIRNSVAANLKARRFVRGASTITMQLAKNLFLSRDKALSRKIEEVILTDYLEQAFRKDDMMELYLNVVEFGPDVYGITQAADHYFGRRPEELSLPECFFLASLLPSPNRYGKLREKNAQVPDSWMHHLRALMEIAEKNGKVSHAELETGLAQEVVFHKPGEPTPEPRKPLNTKRRDPYEDDANWQPLD